ncbi:5-formyltetrahydrofolate cyclo-ligase [Micromonospora pattaloongensis]|uniref:5-formyltetrahydrofolate cyclo-ligase n=1 Tax=Micromonospora pattaloongensis TaxID=405436 RepID=A0A1H3SVP3_9ACTN|nr:5-formyltetrahydrofolate cyclo-ligase [Micromonospora pattaloongensis]SDZ41787.1 5-formyltetrahydrofolate cyclo-ligase [Micromonospora pattaloongensis]
MPTLDASIPQAKQEIRERVWTLLERYRAVDPGVSGHIPAFAGAGAAAERLATLPSWQSARVIKANPDRAQLPVRAQALDADKTVYMAVPNLTTLRPFYLLDPAKLPRPFETSVSHQAVAAAATTVTVDEMPAIDLVVCGSVAVNGEGVRIGKGAGYSDLELALLTEAGLVDAHTTIVTTVHPLQIIDGRLPEAPHDFRVDAIATPDAIITCPGGRRPKGVLWDQLTDDKIAAIPVLASRVLPRRAARREHRSL